MLFSAFFKFFALLFDNMGKDSMIDRDTVNVVDLFD